MPGRRLIRAQVLAGDMRLLAAALVLALVAGCLAPGGGPRADADGATPDGTTADGTTADGSQAGGEEPQSLAGLPPGIHDRTIAVGPENRADRRP